MLMIIYKKRKQSEVESDATTENDSIPSKKRKLTSEKEDKPIKKPNSIQKKALKYVLNVILLIFEKKRNRKIGIRH